MYQNIFIDRDENLVYIWDDDKTVGTGGLATMPYSSFSYCFVPDKNGAYLSMHGKRLSKKFKAYAITGEKYESDVPADTKVLTDLYLHDDDVSTGHVIGYIDIEVDSTDKFPDVNDPQNIVTDITIYDNISEQYIIFSLDEDDTLGSIQIDGAHLHTYISEKELLEAFMSYYQEVQPTIITGWNTDGFDIKYLYNRMKKIVGKNIADRLSPIGKVKYSEFKDRYELAGVASLDYLPLYKKFTYTELPNYRLDTVARAEVGEGKVTYEGSLAEFRKNDPEGFIKYNLQDVKLVVLLDKKLGFIELARGICHVGHIPYEEYNHSSRWIEGTILTYLHRKKIIAPNKPEGGRETFEKQKENDVEGFKGAYVKVPMPGLYEWVYSLDLQSLYPSIIMSLNISPETKVGIIHNWDVRQYIAGEVSHYNVTLYPNTKEETSNSISATSLKKLITEEKYLVSSNGIMYATHKVGIIPEILNKWFAQRKEYKALQSKAQQEGDTVLEEFYDRRQHIQKIFLNSAYGVLGLPIFRFYDVDNALAVTSSGQDVIRNSAEYVNTLYVSKQVTPKSKGWLDLYWIKLKEDAKRRKSPVPAYPLETDHCIYVDTDSLYFSSAPFLNKFTDSEKDKLEFTIKLAGGVEQLLNKYYDELAKEYFNCDTHRLFIRGEAISRTTLWVAKKRYALNKIYDLEKKATINKPPTIKGLDIIRSTCPPAFKRIMGTVLSDILNKTPKETVDKKIKEFHDTLDTLELKEIAKNTVINDLSKYDVVGDESLNTFAKGSTAHAKAALVYNRLLTKLNLQNSYAPIVNKDKIIYVYLKKNKYYVESIAFRGDRDAPQLVQFARENLDYHAQFDRELKNKLSDFYDAMNWGKLPTEINEGLNRFFE